jgi:hypothetical protein
MDRRAIEWARKHPDAIVDSDLAAVIVAVALMIVMFPKGTSPGSAMSRLIAFLRSGDCCIMVRCLDG